MVLFTSAGELRTKSGVIEAGEMVVGVGEIRRKREERGGYFEDASARADSYYS